jgi:hypothetical protein
VKEFRVEEYLDGGSTKEYAIFSDGSRRKLIETDDKYGKYFEVDNWLNDEESVDHYGFTGRIKDMVDTIRNENGDCIQVFHNIYGQHYSSVLYFLDRNIGEELRQKTLERYNGVEFGWAIECKNKNMPDYALVELKDKSKPDCTDGHKQLVFTKKEKAEEYVREMIRRAANYARCISSDKMETSKLIDAMLKEDEEYAGPDSSVIFSFAFDMLTLDLELISDKCKLDNMEYKIVQCTRRRDIVF